MSSRLAPALGLAAACLLLGGIGAYAIETADSPRQPSGVAGAIPLPGLASVASSSPAPLAAAAPQTTAAPKASQSVDATAAGPASSTPSAGAGQPTNQSGQSARSRPSATTADYAWAVFGAVNRARAAQHLPLLAWDARLQQSAHSHNRVMAGSNTLSHQVNTEPALGSRETAAGVQWTYAAENIGWTTQRSMGGVLDIEARMVTETAPNDPHRRNILSRQAKSLGVDVYFDAVHNRLWLTEDFSG